MLAKLKDLNLILLKPLQKTNAFITQSWTSMLLNNYDSSSAAVILQQFAVSSNYIMLA